MEQDLQKPKKEVLDDGFSGGHNNSSSANLHAGEVFMFSVISVRILSAISAFESVDKYLDLMLPD